MDKTDGLNVAQDSKPPEVPKQQSPMEAAIKPSLPRIRNARPIWQEALLFIFTWGIYASFWLVGRLRDINSVSKQALTPWLWFFVPNVVLAQPIAFTALFKELTSLEGEHTNSGWQKFSWLWTTLFMLFTAVGYVADRLHYSTWFYILTYVGILVLLCLLHDRFNQWKSRLENVELHSKANGYSVVEWISMLVGGICLVLFVYFIYVQLALNTIRTLDDQQLIEKQNPSYSLKIHGAGWSEVSIGTRSSDGDSEYELNGPLLGSWFVIFDHGKSNSIDAVARGRATYRDGLGSKPKCSEERILSIDQESIISYTECKGRTLGDPMTSFSTVIETDKHIVELYGEISGVEPEYKNVHQQMHEMARGFKPQ